MIRKFLAQNSIFTLDEFVEYLNTQGTVNKHTQTSTLNYHISKGHIIRLKRGLFASVPELFDPETVPLDPLAIAAKLSPDSILAYHTALEAHGVAYSTYHTFTYLTEKKNKVFEFRDQYFQAIKQPTSLYNIGEQNFACKQIQRSGISVKITSLERTFVDVIDKPNLSGGWEEILSSFDVIAVLDLDLLIEYSLLLNNASVVSKVGYFLEVYQTKLGVTEQHLEYLEKYASKSKIYLERSKRESGIFMQRWNLLVPEYIINRSWDELL